MIEIYDFLIRNKNKQKFKLPISWSGRFSLWLFFNIVKMHPLRHEMFINNKYLKSNYYWTLLFGYLKNKYNITHYSRKVYYKDVFLHFESKLTLLEDGFEIYGYGTSQDEEVAYSKSLGEFLERYSFFSTEINKNNNFEIKNFQELLEKGSVCFVNHDEEYLFKAREYFENKKIKTVKTISLLSGKNANFPYSQVFLRDAEMKGEYNLWEVNSNGLAGGFDKEQAISSALLELVERDSFLCHWFTKTSPEIIVLNEGEIAEYDVFLKSINTDKFKVYVLNTSSEIPVFTVSILVENIETKGIVVNCGAGFTVEDAILSALREVRSAMFAFEKLYQESFEIQVKNNTISKNDRIKFWVNNRDIKSYQFFISGKSIDLQKLKSRNFVSNLQELILFFKQNVEVFGDIFVYETKNILLKKLNFYAVRVLAPKLYPMKIHVVKPFLNSKRIFAFCESKNTKISKSNTKVDIHPFP
jgi:ribosomal protein S12 methylthiotransferase accessory factor